jgi:hypothetical protein
MSAETSLNIEITVFTNSSGPLSKALELDDNGSVRKSKDVSHMSAGTACRTRIDSLETIRTLLDTLTPCQAISIGSMRADLPDTCTVTTAHNLTPNSPKNLIARSQEYLEHRQGKSALLLVDVDTKGMPTSIKTRIDENGGHIATIVEVIPDLMRSGYVYRSSTSSNLYNSDTGSTLQGSDGLHIYIPVADGADIKRSLRVMHERMWLAGYGWYVISASGDLLERSLIDVAVGGPERLIYEGAPVLRPPLAQSPRHAIVVGGVS